MSARDDYRAAEEKLAEVEMRIEDLRAWGISFDRWERDFRKETPRPPRPPGDLSDLLLQRERLQEESYKAYRRVVAEREG